MNEIQLYLDRTDDNILAMWNQGMTSEEIANGLGIDVDYIWKVLSVSIGNYKGGKL